MRRANIGSSIVLLLFALYMIVEAIRMEYKTADGVPGPGFIPLYTGLLIGVAALLILYFNWIKKESDTDKSPEFNFRFWLNSAKIIGGSALSMVLVDYLGMLVSVGILTGFLSWTLGTEKWLTNILLAIITPLVFFLVFQLGLDMNFPKGLFGF